jgi:hypothetical protein
MAWLSGKKTYLAASLMIVYAISGLLLGHIDPGEAWESILQATAIIGLRLGIEKSK